MADTGYAKVIEALGKLIAYLETLDPTKYNPTNLNLTIDALQDLRTAATAALAAVSAAYADWRTKAKDRTLIIEKLPATAAQAVALFESLGADAERIEQARSYVRKLQGRRAAPAVADNPDTPEDESAQNISASQKSAAQMIAHFGGLVDFLAAQDEYQGITVAGLKLTDLVALRTQAQSAHDDSIAAEAQISSKRSARNSLLYDDNDSILKRAAAVKKFVFAVYGATSDEFKTVNGIEFKKR